MRNIKLVLEDGSEITIRSDNPERYVDKVLETEHYEMPRQKRVYVRRRTITDISVPRQRPRVITERIIPSRNGFGNRIEPEELDSFKDDTTGRTVTTHSELPRRFKRKHFYHGKLGVQPFIEKNRAKIEKDILNPNLTIQVVAKRHLLGSTTLYNYFPETMKRRMTLYPFLRRGKNMERLLSGRK